MAIDWTKVTKVFKGYEEVEKIYAGYEDVYEDEPSPSIDYTIPFWVENTSGQEGEMTCSWAGGSIDPEYSTDGINWSAANYVFPLAVPAGGKVYMRSEAYNATTTNYTVFTIGMNVTHKAGGNILSLCDKTNYATLTEAPGKCLGAVFSGDTNLTDASEINFGHITTTGNNLCRQMFSGCTSLVNVPDLSKFTVISQYGMGYMFSNCTSLVTPPNLSSVRSVTTSGLMKMFSGCTSLTSGANITGITTSSSGMRQMYLNCSSLTVAYAPNLSTWNTANTQNWLSGVAASGTLYCPSERMYNSIPANSVAGCPAGWTKAQMTSE